MRNNLTLNLGLRYERTTVPTGQKLAGAEFAVATFRA